jgi:hypothetical protein
VNIEETKWKSEKTIYHEAHEGFGNSLALTSCSPSKIGKERSLTWSEMTVVVISSERQKPFLTLLMIVGERKLIKHLAVNLTVSTCPLCCAVFFRNTRLRRRCADRSDDAIFARPDVFFQRRAEGHRHIKR